MTAKAHIKIGHGVFVFSPFSKWDTMGFRAGLREAVVTRLSTLERSITLPTCKVANSRKRVGEAGDRAWHLAKLTTGRAPEGKLSQVQTSVKRESPVQSDEYSLGICFMLETSNNTLIFTEHLLCV